MTNVTATEAARTFSDLLNRVAYRNESFAIVRNGVEVARLEPAEKPPVTLRELFELLLPYRTGDPGFADDLERIHADQPTEIRDPWES